MRKSIFVSVVDLLSGVHLSTDRGKESRVPAPSLFRASGPQGRGHRSYLCTQPSDALILLSLRQGRAQASVLCEQVKTHFLQTAVLRRVCMRFASIYLLINSLKQ